MIFLRPPFWLVINLGLALLVFRDQRLNGRSGIGWAVFVFFFGIIGLIIYILISTDTLKLSAARAKGKKLSEKLESSTYRKRTPEVDRSELSLPPDIDVQHEKEEEQGNT
jgi:hypothetical protein